MASSGFDDYLRYSRRHLQRAVEAVRDRTAELARQKVPVRTGRTRASIYEHRIIWIGSECGTSVEAGVAAIFLEFGTVKMSARPFLGPAAREAVHILKGTPFVAYPVKKTEES